MKTREAAKLLYTIARMLDSLPNEELETVTSQYRSAPKKIMSSEQISLNIDTLIKLSSIEKNQWIFFAKENHFEIDFRPRDASRDILGKILKYIEQHPEARQTIAKKAAKVQDSNSIELTTALKLLLGK